MSELIDREATVKQICKIGEMVGGHDRDVVISIALFVQDDKTAFPTVERPHGEWIFRPYADYNPTMGDIVCSKCDIVYFEGVPESRMKYKLYHFCPNCGASMRKEEEGEAE